MEIRKVTQDQWEAEGKRRFGNDWMKWKFICSVCKHVASIQDWKDVGASEGEVAFSCVGRHMEKQAKKFGHKEKGDPDSPCDYAGGGLFRLNPIHVEYRDEEGTIRQCFDFAPVEGVEPWTFPEPEPEPEAEAIQE